MHKKIQLLRSLLGSPHVECSIGHELQSPAPDHVCIYGTTPRYKIGCMHSFIPNIVVEVLLASKGKKDVRDRLLERTVLLKKNLGALDNAVYEKTLFDEDVIKNEQQALSQELEEIVKETLACTTIKNK